MRVATILTILIFALVACDGNYDAPQPYGVGAHYGGGGMAYANQAGGTQFEVPDAGSDTTATVDAVEEDIPAFDLTAELMGQYEQCLDEYDNNVAYCQCLFTGTEQPECYCRHIICIDQPDPALDFDTWIPECQYQFSIFTGVCTDAG